MTRRLFTIAAVVLASASLVRTQETVPLRLAIVGLVHGHVSGFLRSALARQDIRIVALFDPDAQLLRGYSERYKLPEHSSFTELDAMLDATKPDAVAVFTNTYDHASVVEAVAKRRIPVMMEKPLAVSN